MKTLTKPMFTVLKACGCFGDKPANHSEEALLPEGVETIKVDMGYKVTDVAEEKLRQEQLREAKIKAERHSEFAKEYDLEPLLPTEFNSFPREVAEDNTDLNNLLIPPNYL